MAHGILLWLGCAAALAGVTVDSARDDPWVSARANGPSRASAQGHGRYLRANCGYGEYTKKHLDTLNVASCAFCHPGKFKGVTGHLDAECDLCPGGWTTHLLKEQVSRQSYESKMAQNFAQCVKCPSGWYSNSDSNQICAMCPNGWVATQPATAACSECQRGFVAIANDIACEACPAGYRNNKTGQAHLKQGCGACLAGKYTNQKGSSTCKDCKSGQYQDAMANTTCKMCSKGQSTEGSGSTFCRKCEGGQYLDSAQHVCRACPVGQVAKMGAQTDACVQCLPGQTPNNDKTECDSCGLGRYGDVSLTCHDCPIGKYQDDKAETDCKDCRINRYGVALFDKNGRQRPAVSNTECVPCPTNPDQTTGGVTGADSKDACLCPRTAFYQSSDDQNTTQCVPCPEGADCSARDGIPLDEVVALPGYWRTNIRGNTFSSCAQGFNSLIGPNLALLRCCPMDPITNQSICKHSTNTTNASEHRLRHIDDQCLAGYAGVLCMVCDEGYVRAGQDCIACAGGASLGIALVPMIVVLASLFVSVFILMIKGRKASEQAETVGAQFGQAKIVLSFLQILSSMPNVLDSVPWPAAFLHFTLPLGLSNLDFLSLVSGTSCGMNVRYFDKFVLHMVFPVACVLTIAVAYKLALRKVSAKKNAARSTEIKKTAAKASILIILFTYPGISTRIFSMFKCKSVPGVSDHLLMEDFRVSCYRGEHVPYSIMGYAFLLLYVIGIPALMFVLLWRNRRHLHNKTSGYHHELVKNALGGLYLGYENEYWWFEVFLLFNKTLMCGGLVIAAPGTSLQVLLAVLIMLFHLLVVLKLAPYVDDHQDWTSFVSALTLLLTTLGAWALRTNDPDVSTFQNDVLAGLLIAISCFCLVSQFVIVVFFDFGLWECAVKAQRKRDNKMKSRGIKTDTGMKEGSKKLVFGKTAVVPTRL